MANFVKQMRDIPKNGCGGDYQVIGFSVVAKKKTPRPKAKT